MSDRIASRDLLILGAILLVAALLRAIGLNGPLWYDEILTLETHLRLPLGQMMEGYEMNHHYLFSFQSKLAMAVFGDSAWAIRLPAFLFGVASIAAIWVLAHDIAGRVPAHVTAFLLAISFHHIWFSQNARGYTELAFWSALAMILFLRGLARPGIGIWLGYGACLALAIFTHLTGAFFFVAQGLIWLVIAARTAMTDGVSAPTIRLPALGYVAGGILTLILYAPVLPGVLETTGSVGAGSAVDVMQEYQNPVWTVIEAVRTGIGALGPLVAIVALMVIGLAVLGAAAIWPRDRIVAPTVLLHIVLTMALLSALGMRIWPRFFFIDIGFLMFLIVMGVSFVCTQISTRITAKLPWFGLAAAGMIVISAGLAARNFTAPKQDLAGAVALVDATRSADDTVYAIGVAHTVFRDHFATGWQDLPDAAAFDQAIDASEPALFVVAFPQRYFRAIPRLDDMADAGELELIERLPGTLGDGAVYVFRRN